MISRTLLGRYFGEDGEDKPSGQGGWRLSGGAGECHCDQQVIWQSGKIGKIGRIIATRAREHVSTGRGVPENLLTRRLKISSLSSLSSLRRCQPIETAGKDQRGAARVILPIGEVILPILPMPLMDGAGCRAKAKIGHNILRKAA